jgi:fluoroacetyl-CoA thioesterase
MSALEPGVHGAHERFVVDLPDFEGRLATKAEQVR